MSVSLFIIEDKSLDNDSLEYTLGTENNLELVGCAGDINEAFFQLENLDPDVILFDTVNVPISHIYAVREIRATCPSLRILALGKETTPGFIDHIKWCGVHGYILKPVSNKEIVDASYAIHNRALYKAPQITKRKVPSRRQISYPDKHDVRELERTALFV